MKTSLGSNLEPLGSGVGEWIEQAEKRCHDGSAMAEVDLQQLNHHMTRRFFAQDHLMKRLRMALMSERSGDLLQAKASWHCPRLDVKEDAVDETSGEMIS